MELNKAKEKLKNKVENWNKCKKDICSVGELYEDIDEENIAIDTVLNELDNRISVKKVEQLINKIKNETWYIEGGTEAKQACIEELESLLNKE